GGVLARRFLVPLVLVAVGLGWVRLAGQEAGYYDSAFGTAARTLVEITLFTLMLWWTANGLTRAERELRVSESRARRLVELNKRTMDNMGEGVYTIDNRGVVTFMNREAVRLFGLENPTLIGRNIH